MRSIPKLLVIFVEGCVGKPFCRVSGWAVLEWECCLKDSEQGAAEGAPFIAAHIIQVAHRAFDDFAASGIDQAANRKLLGLS